MVKHAVVLFVHLPLFRVGFANHGFLAAAPAPAGEETDARAGLGLVIDNEIRVIAIFPGTVSSHKSRKLQS